MRKNLIRYMAMMFIVGMLAAMMPGKVYALNPQEELVEASVAAAYRIYGEETAFTGLKNTAEQYAAAGKPLNSQLVQDLVNKGCFPNHVDDLKALGYTDVDYSPVTGGSNNTTSVQQEPPTPAPEPVAFTVEDMDETTMWTISEVNYRDGASTDYAKLGSLAKYDEVTVNGVASTGWYRFKLDGDKVAYVSNNYLTTEDPHDRELNIYNEETGTVDTYNFENQEPEVIDEAIEEIKEDYEEKEPEVKEPEPEGIEEPSPIVEEPKPAVETEPEKEPRSIYWWLVVIGGVGAFLVVCIAVFFLIYNKTSHI